MTYTIGIANPVTPPASFFTYFINKHKCQTQASKSPSLNPNVPSKHHLASGKSSLLCGLPLPFPLAPNPPDQPTPSLHHHLNPWGLNHLALSVTLLVTKVNSYIALNLLGLSPAYPEMSTFHALSSVCSPFFS